MCGAFEGWRRATVLDPSASLGMTSCRDERAWMDAGGSAERTCGGGLGGNCQISRGLIEVKRSGELNRRW